MALAADVKAHVAEAVISIEAALMAAEKGGRAELEIVQELLREVMEILEEARVVKEPEKVVKFPRAHGI